MKIITKIAANQKTAGYLTSKHFIASYNKILVGIWAVIFT